MGRHMRVVSRGVLVRWSAGRFCPRVRGSSLCGRRMLPVVVAHEEEVAAGLLLAVLDGSAFVDARPVVGRVAAESNRELLQKLVHAGKQALRRRRRSLDGRPARVHLEHRLQKEGRWLSRCPCPCRGGRTPRLNRQTLHTDNDAVREVRGHDEVVLDDKRSLFRVHDKTLDDFSADDALLRVQVSRRLVDQIDFGRFAQRQRHGHALELAAGEVLHFLVDDRVDLHGFHHVGAELRVHVRVADSLVQKLTNRPVEFRGNLLRFIRHGQLRHGATVRLLLVALGQGGALFVGSQQTREHADKSRLASAVFAEEHDNLRILKVPCLHVQNELVVALAHHRLRHVRLVLRQRVLAADVFGGLRELESQALVAEAQVLRRHEPGQEDVDALAHGKGHGDDAVAGRRAVEAADVV
ncbi:hypothetical protein M885DRAFT_85990 [Pelagophyceae sp. CCMP2097]|nr:hypothetical protein M885DRAFT_85990 [Pelagophyceae sp. CCMP2097]